MNSFETKHIERVANLINISLAAFFVFVLVGFGFKFEIWLEEPAVSANPFSPYTAPAVVFITGLVLHRLSKKSFSLANILVNNIQHKE